MIHATVIGNLGRDAEIKSVNQKTVVNFSIGAKGRGRDAATTWVRGALWGKRGEAVAEYLTKGKRVACSGTLSTREYDGKTYVELDVQELELLGDAPGGGGGRPAPKAQRDDDEPPF